MERVQRRIRLLKASHLLAVMPESRKRRDRRQQRVKEDLEDFTVHMHKRQRQAEEMQNGVRGKSGWDGEILRTTSDLGRLQENGVTDVSNSTQDHSQGHTCNVHTVWLPSVNWTQRSL